MGKRKKGKPYHDSLPFEIVFFLCFFAGIIFANLFQTQEMDSGSVINSYYLQELRQSPVNRLDYMFYVLEIRLPELLGILILGMTGIYVAVHYLFVSWIGVSLGFWMATSIMSLGVQRLPFILMCIFPQYIFYFFVYLEIVKLQRQYHRNEGKRRLGEWIALVAVLAMTFILGILMEVYLSPAICRHLL